MTMLSIIIPCRGEANLLWFTLQSLAFDDLDDVEIIVVDNGPSDEVMRVCLEFGHPVRYVADVAVQSPYYPRNVGASVAKGEWLLFLDAHVLLNPGAIDTIKSRICPGAVLDGACYPPLSMVHFPVGFRNQKTWYGHYKLTLAKNFWGEWGPTSKGVLTGRSGTYPIGASGIWAFLTRKADWEAVGGFNPNFTGYGGGEVYLQLKYWRMGGQVLLDPAIWGVHWSAPRTYAANWRDRIRNVGIGGTAVVGPSFWKRFEDGLVAHYVSKGVVDAEARTWLREGTNLGLEEADWLAEQAKFSYDEVLELWKREHVAVA
jgi:glycosyltransferase involved in cell wall biosynthesis